MMKALVLDEYGLKYKVNAPTPKMGAEDVLVRVEAVGICGTDIAIIKHTLEAPLPIIPGHEIAGIIEKVGAAVPSDIGALVGKRVTMEINTRICGTCFYCKSGMPTQCINRKALGIDINGGMAEFVTIHHSLIHLVPPKLTPEEATLIEPLAAALQTFEMMPIQDGDRSVVLIGDGKLALLILGVLVAFKKGFGESPFRGEIMMVGHHESKLEIARMLGADMTLNSSVLPERKLLKKVFAFTGEQGADVTIEATGNPRALNQAILITRARGNIGLKSTHGVSVPFNLTLAVVKELTLYTSRCGPFEKAIRLIQEIQEPFLKHLISGVYPLSKGKEAFKDLEYRRDALKYVLKP
ncbi:alcohol dehydrogenase catalytic domain-containing protein [Candidatus Bathyarchaeota archaeon]|nr:alcohol dehydrogenase catalytic domain-containing protein [Candidatus Bathyarchaeota archaeon]